MKTLTNYFSIGVVSVSLLGLGFAADVTTQTTNSNTPMLPLQKPGMQKMHHGHFHFSNPFFNSLPGTWVIGLHQAKQLTPDQAKIVAEAAVILYGDGDMQVGSVTAVPDNNGHNNYQIQITNKSGQVLTTLTMKGTNGKIINNSSQVNSFFQ